MLIKHTFSSAHCLDMIQFQLTWCVMPSSICLAEWLCISLTLAFHSLVGLLQGCSQPGAGTHGVAHISVTALRLPRTHGHERSKDFHVPYSITTAWVVASQTYQHQLKGLSSPYGKGQAWVSHGNPINQNCKNLCEQQVLSKRICWAKVLFRDRYLPGR